jgi:nitroimidazol reductase NimA-like FMN-containing flavoprotein (pyridoxamine 5'-phosphate oxidase superfamily)
MAENLIAHLEENACLELLREHHFGRVAFMEQADGPPLIMPVNYLMYRETVVFRTDPNSKLGRAVQSTIAAFEMTALTKARERAGASWCPVVRKKSWTLRSLMSSVKLHCCPGLPVIVPNTSGLHPSS